MDLASKIVLGVTLVTLIVGSILLYKFHKNPKFSPYYYLTATIAMLEGFSFLCFDSLMFSVEHDYIFYYSELGIYLGILVLAILIMFFIRLYISKRKKD